MKALTIFLVALTTLLPALRAEELSPETLRLAKLRIETLLGNRRGASPTPVNPANPFLLPESATPPVEGQTTTVEAPATKSVALSRLAATLNVSGYIENKGIPLLTINRQTYRQNDLIPVRDGGGSVSFLLLKAITETDFTLELDGIELQQKHTVK